MEWTKNKYGSDALIVPNPYYPKQKVTVYTVGQGSFEDAGKWFVMGEYDDYFSQGFDTQEEAVADAERRFAEHDHTELFRELAYPHNRIPGVVEWVFDCLS